MLQEKPKLHLEFDPASICPEQYLDMIKANHHTPEKRLRYAILYDAVQIYLNHDNTPQHRKSHREATEWLYSSNEAPFSCNFILDLLSIDRSYFRSILLRAKSIGIRVSQRQINAPGRHKVQERREIRDGW